MNTIDTTTTPSTKTTPHATTTPGASRPSLSPSALPSADAAAAKNDNALPKRIAADPRALVAHPEVLRAIEGTLLNLSVKRGELVDSVAEVQVRVLHATRKKPLPAAIGEWKALACTIAERMVLKARAREKKRSRWNAGLCETPDDNMPVQRSPARRRDPVDMKRQIEVARGLFEAGKMPKDGDLIIFRDADGFTAKEIAGELAVSVGTVEKRLSRMRKLYNAKLASLGMLVMTLLVAMIFAAPFGAGVGSARPPEDAPTLRREALEACDAGQWRICLDELDEARELDPSGDETPALRAARERAEGALLENRHGSAGGNPAEGN